MKKKKAEVTSHIKSSQHIDKNMHIFLKLVKALYKKNNNSSWKIKHQNLKVYLKVMNPSQFISEQDFELLLSYKISKVELCRFLKKQKNFF